MNTVLVHKPVSLITLKQRNDSQPRKWLIAIVLFVPFIALWSVSSGAMNIDVLSILLSNTLERTSEFHERVLFDIRLPRLLMTFATGAGLAICGAVLQSLFRNPLAEPGLLGISSGAALFAAVGFLVLSQFAVPDSLTFAFIPFMAFLGAGAAVVGLFLLNVGNKDVNTLLLILSGVAINASAMTLLGIVTYLVDDSTLRLITFWSMGSYSGIGWPVATATCIFVALAAAYFYYNKGALTLMSFSEKQALYQGVNTTRIKVYSLAFVAVVTAFCVSFTGIVGFVGLVIPHLSRMIIGSNLNFSLPLSILLGGTLVSVADTLSRTVIAPAELPIGLITSALGIPFFLYLIVKAKR